MNKKINIILASVLCSFNLMAQVDTLTIHKDKVVIDYGRNITHDAREVTGAVFTATSDKLSHKNSINATNQLFGMLPGLQVLQNAGYISDKTKKSGRIFAYYLCFCLSLRQI